MEVYRPVVVEEGKFAEELFTDSTPLDKTHIDKGIIGIPVWMRTKNTGIDESKIGANASAEEQQEELEEVSEKCLTCSDYNVNKVPDYATLFPTQKTVIKYTKKYMTSVLKVLKTSNPERFKALVTDKDGKKTETILTDMVGAFAALYTDPEECDIFSHLNAADDGDFVDITAPNKPLFIASWNDDGESLTLWTLIDCFEASKT